MDPCPFLRILVGNLALKSPALIPSKSAFSLVHPSSSPFFCKIKLGNFPSQFATVPLVPQETHTSDDVVSFTLTRKDIEKLGEKSLFSTKEPRLQILVYTGRRGRSCGFSAGKLLGRVTVGLDLKGAVGRACVFHNGWVSVGGESSQLYLSVRAEPDPRFVFQFGGEPECSPQVFQIQGNLRQPVFTCKFSFRNSGDRSLRSRSSISEASTSRSWFSSKDEDSKERKGWSITIHDLSGCPVAAASMTNPFVPSPGSGRVKRSNPGAWLILRPEDGTWKPWGRLEAWREPDGLGHRFELLPDATGGPAVLLASSTLSTKKGGKFTIDSSSRNFPVTTPRGACESGTRSWVESVYRGFVMSSTVGGEGRCSTPEVEVGVKHVTCTEDAAAFVALAAAMDLSMDACKLFSQKLRKELRRQQSEEFVV